MNKPKYLYVTYPEQRFDDDLTGCRLRTPDRLKACDKAIRVLIPDDMELSFHGDFYSTKDERPLRLLGTDAMLRVNGRFRPYPPLNGVRIKLWEPVIAANFIESTGKPGYRKK